MPVCCAKFCVITQSPVFRFQTQGTRSLGIPPPFTLLDEILHPGAKVQVVIRDDILIPDSVSCINDLHDCYSILFYRRAARPINPAPTMPIPVAAGAIPALAALVSGLPPPPAELEALAALEEALMAELATLEATEDAAPDALFKAEEAEEVKLESDAESVTEALALDRLDAMAEDSLEREEESEDVTL